MPTPRLDMDTSLKSVLMKDILQKIESVAKLDRHVIIIGETGSGKKELARILHENSNRCNGPFHSFYCIDVNESLFKDAFWEKLHVDNDHLILKYDAIEKSSEGILYLDQFGELSHQFMVRIIESFLSGCKHVFRNNKADCPRLLISINQESYTQLLQSSTWDTLLQMLDPIAIMLPPLRERKEDIPVYIEFFLNEIRDRYRDWSHLSISNHALSECHTYGWPGNIRQLKNALFQGALSCSGQTIESQHLPFSMKWTLPYAFEGNP